MNIDAAVIVVVVPFPASLATIAIWRGIQVGDWRGHGKGVGGDKWCCDDDWYADCTLFKHNETC